MAVNTTLVLVGSSTAFWAVVTLVASAGIGLAIGVYKKCKNMFRPPPGSHVKQKLPTEELTEILREAEKINVSADAIRERVIRQEQLLQVREEVRQQHAQENEGGSEATSTHTRRE